MFYYDLALLCNALCVGRFGLRTCEKKERKNDAVEVFANDQDNCTTSSYVAFTESERLIGRKFADPVVRADIKLWPFKFSSGAGDKPMIEVNYLGENRNSMRKRSLQ